MTLAAIHLAAFGQGKVTFGNDANHLVNIWSRYPVWSFPGEYVAAPQIGTPKDVMGSLTAQLFAGNTPYSLMLQSTMTPAGLAGLPDGRLRNVAVTLTGIPGGVNAYFQIQIWETSAGSFANALNGGGWAGQTAVFSATPGSFAPNFLITSRDWVGPIHVGSPPIPEPSTLALVGLGLASVMLVLRRKSARISDDWKSERVR